MYDLAQAQRTRLERELEMARAVQASLLPGQLPNIPGIGLAASWRSAREVAGDFYDISLPRSVPLPPKRPLSLRISWPTCLLSPRPSRWQTTSHCSS